MSPVSKLHLLTIGSLLFFAFAEASIELVRIAALPGRFGGPHPCFDANGNQGYEVYGNAGLDQNSIDSLLIREYAGGNTFLDIRTGLVPGGVCDVGNGDNDGLVDMVTLRGAESLCVYEATAPGGFLSQLVWASTDLAPGSGSYAQFCDLDRDGLPEIVTAGWDGDGVMVFENRGDNAYAEVPFPHSHETHNVMCSFATGDFDGDSMTEVVGGTSEGDILVYECSGDDQYARVCSLGFYPSEIEAYSHAAANDMDRNGYPEFISVLRRWNMPADSCRIRVYEEPEHGRLVCVDSFTYSNWGYAAATGGVDGDSIDEFAVSTGSDVRLFKSTGPAQYEQVWLLDRGNVPWLRFFDINRDGRVELIFTVPRDSTYIF